MNSNIVFAVFAGNNTSVIASHAWQYDYGQILRIQGLHLPAAVEVHFAIEDEETSTTRVGETYEDYAGEISKTIWNSPKWEDRNPKNGVLSVDASINPLKGLL